MDGMKETLFVLLLFFALKGLWSTLLLAGAAFRSIFSARQTNASWVSGNAWEAGSTQQVTWTFKGAVPEVDIDLWSVCTWTHLLPGCYEVQYLESLVRRAKNHGSHFVTVPTGLMPGKYYLVIRSSSDRRISATSPTFTIDKMATPPEINEVAIPRCLVAVGRLQA
eukprot:scaffold321_cov67-Phaeocystis_antarctica.AAC.7